MPAPIFRTAVSAVSTVLVGLTLTVAIGCAPAGRPAGHSAPPRSSAHAITAREIAAATSSTTAYEAIQRLRPLWLSGRGAGRPLVYVDNIWRGGFEELYRISPADIQEIQLLRGYDATTRWGTGHAAGVILVTTRR
jgi:hypothetical protein